LGILFYTNAFGCSLPSGNSLHRCMLPTHTDGRNNKQLVVPRLTRHTPTSRCSSCTTQAEFHVIRTSCHQSAPLVLITLYHWIYNKCRGALTSSTVNSKHACDTSLPIFHRAFGHCNSLNYPHAYCLRSPSSVHWTALISGRLAQHDHISTMFSMKVQHTYRQLNYVPSPQLHCFLPHFKCQKNMPAHLLRHTRLKRGVP
jgi:hypothetical protein